MIRPKSQIDNLEMLLLLLLLGQTHQLAHFVNSIVVILVDFLDFVIFSFISFCLLFFRFAFWGIEYRENTYNGGIVYGRHSGVPIIIPISFCQIGSFAAPSLVSVTAQADPLLLQSAIPQR